MASEAEHRPSETATSDCPPPPGTTAPSLRVQTEPHKQDADASTRDGATAPPGVTLCGVCNTDPSKYKCPRCYLPYCSVACNKTHRENHPPDPEPKPEHKQQPKNKSEAPPNDSSVPTDPRNPFRALDSSDKLKVLFAKYPSLPNQLLQIHAATMPPPEATETRGIPASLMQGVQKKSNWNHDVGIQNGKAALRKARKASGEEGEAIREYSELILHLLGGGDSLGEMTSLLHQQMAEQDTKLIERLMAEEKR